MWAPKELMTAEQYDESMCERRYVVMLVSYCCGETFFKKMHGFATVWPQEHK